MMLLPWHQVHWERLHAYIRHNRIPQALLIAGNKGLGKVQIAEQLTAALLCRHRDTGGMACSHCESCMLIKAGTHPDKYLVQPEETGKSINIAQIRDLLEKLSLKPQFQQFRVAMINPADRMTFGAANAFLKFLEEPTERTMLLLISERSSKLPATILSRCQKIILTPPDKALAVDWLHNQPLTDQQQPIQNWHDYLFMAQGAPLLALVYATDNVLMIRNQCFDSWVAIAERRQSPLVVAENWLQLSLALLIFWMTSWIIDLARCFHFPLVENLYNPDLKPQLISLSEGIDLKKLYQLYDVLLQSRMRMDTSVNRQLMIEEILIQWYEINRKK